LPRSSLNGCYQTRCLKGTVIRSAHEILYLIIHIQSGHTVQTNNASTSPSHVFMPCFIMQPSARLYHETLIATRGHPIVILSYRIMHIERSAGTQAAASGNPLEQEPARLDPADSTSSPHQRHFAPCPYSVAGGRSILR
jgi:hypothetical protein